MMNSVGLGVCLPERRCHRVVRCIQIVKCWSIIINNVHSGTNNYITTIVCKQTAFPIQLFAVGRHIDHMFELQIDKSFLDMAKSNQSQSNARSTLTLNSLSNIWLRIE